MAKDMEKENTYKNGNIQYDGDWVDDCAEGNGKLIYENGWYYIGQFKKGIKIRKGVEYDEKGIIRYEGDFLNNKRQGNGKFIFPSGDYYIGEFKNNVMHGKGKHYQKGSLMIEGNYINNRLNVNIMKMEILYMRDILLIFIMKEKVHFIGKMDILCIKVNLKKELEKEKAQNIIITETLDTKEILSIIKGKVMEKIIIKIFII